MLFIYEAQHTAEIDAGHDRPVYGVMLCNSRVSQQASGVHVLTTKRRVMVLGATGTAGQATTRALHRAGHQVTCIVRPGKSGAHVSASEGSSGLPDDVAIRECDVSDPVSLKRDGFKHEHFDVLVSCMASRTGTPNDAWAIDHRAQATALAAAKESSVQHMVLLSAICVQKPLLEFQHAKLAFERELMASGLTYSIVRPTAFFKSLSGQVERVRAGKPFLLFGDGRLTACKPISDDDLGDFMASCIADSARHNKILPIGGPGPAITLRDQGEHLFRLTGRQPRFRKVPVGMFVVAHRILELLGRVNKACADKAELARIGHYYATESMLVLDPETGRYDADATPSFGTETLFDFYAALLDGTTSVKRGEHAIFRERAD